MPASEILSLLFSFSGVWLQWVIIFFTWKQRFVKNKQTNQWNPDGLLTLNYLGSNVIPDGKIGRNGWIWLWGYVHLEVWVEYGPWKLPLAAHHELAGLFQHSELWSCLQLLKETSANKNINFTAPQQNLGNLQFIRNVFRNLISVQYGLKPNLKITTFVANQKSCGFASSNHNTLFFL